MTTSFTQFKDTGPEAIFIVGEGSKAQTMSIRRGCSIHSSTWPRIFPRCLMTQSRKHDSHAINQVKTMKCFPLLDKLTCYFASKTQKYLTLCQKTVAFSDFFYFSANTGDQYRMNCWKSPNCTSISLQMVTGQ